ncbi:MAG: peptidylprolyl isomerase [Acidobacteriota bacterium]|nr:peptidylprolyl isomerase [Acidobacteriota bacterium]
MTLRLIRIPAAFVFGTVLLASSAMAQTRASAPASPYGGTTVQEIIARVNDQIITSSDYDRAMKELDQEEHQRGASMQEISDAHRDLLRNLIDQQLWLSKGKELGITGETELVNRLNDIRKQYNLASLEDLEKAAQQQGVSYEDFKANIRNGIITQQVMRDEVGRKISMTPGEAQRYFEEHKQEYAKQESVKLSEILVSTGTPVPSPTDPGGVLPTDPQKLAEAKAKAEEIEAKLNAGGDFSQLARSFSDGPTAATGGDLGEFKRGSLAKVLEDQVFALKAGQITPPIRTRQGYVILKVAEHTPGGVPPFKDVEQDVEQAYYMSKMEPAMRDYLTKMRDEAFIEIKPGYVDTGTSPNKRVFPIAYAAYTPPAPKKKKKVERTRFRETAHGYRQTGAQAQLVEAKATTTPEKATKKGKKNKNEQAAMKPGKKEKIRFGKAPQETLPSAAASQTEDAGAVSQTADNAPEPVNPLEAAPAPKAKTRFSYRAKEEKQKKVKASKQPQKDALTPEPPDAAEVADRQLQSAPLGLGGNVTGKKKKKEAATTGEKTRLSDRNKAPAEQTQPSGQTPPGAEAAPQAPATGAPAPQQ